MRLFTIVIIQLLVYIFLQHLQRIINFLAGCDRIKLVEIGFVEAFTDPISLWMTLY